MLRRVAWSNLNDLYTKRFSFIQNLKILNKKLSIQTTQGQESWKSQGVFIILLFKRKYLLFLIFFLDSQFSSFDLGLSYVSQSPPPRPHLFSGEQQFFSPPRQTSI